MNAAWLPAEAAASLVRLAYAERALAHIRAGWAAKLPSFEAKLTFGLHLQRAMERATALRSRVNGLCHAVADEATVPAGWRALFMAMDLSPAPADLIAAIYRWLYPQLIALYEIHLARTDRDGDRASVELLQSFLPALDQEQNEGLALFAGRPDTDDKTLVALWAERDSGEPLTLEHAVWAPLDRVPQAARPEGAQFGISGSLGLLPVDPLNDDEGIAMFLHKELDEEFTTLELIARNSYEHPDMPWAFHRDMARQASDEARHAVLIARLMAARGVGHGDFPLTKSSYDGLYEFEPCAPGSRRELLWRMLIRQTFMEWLAVDNLALEIARRRAAGQADIAHVFEYILRDEVFHAQSGLRWSRELLGVDAMTEERERAFAYFTARAEAAREAFVLDNLDLAMAELAAIEEGKERRGTARPERPLNHTGRRQAGYSDDDIR